MSAGTPDLKRAWTACFSHLPKVSRTFALAIAGLPEPLRGEVCVAYLLCRMLDTVEDAPGLASDSRWALIGPLLDRLRDEEDLPESWFSGVEDLLVARSSAGDFALMKDGALVLSAFRACRPSARPMRACADLMPRFTGSPHAPFCCLMQNAYPPISGSVPGSQFSRTSDPWAKTPGTRASQTQPTHRRNPGTTTCLSIMQHESRAGQTKKARSHSFNE